MENSELNTKLRQETRSYLNPRIRNVHDSSRGINFGVIEFQEGLESTEYKLYISDATKYAALFLNRVYSELVQVHLPDENGNNSDLLSDDVIKITIQATTKERHQTDNEVSERTPSPVQDEIMYFRKLLHDVQSPLEDLLQENQKIKAKLTRIHKAKAATDDATSQQSQKAILTQEKSQLSKKITALFGLE
ncbi:MAG: hypothetical protein HDS78_03365 [Bacteroidales bacterium]|nr:hypothetical protein [Bacteroidales bacterium]